MSMKAQLLGAAMVLGLFAGQAVAASAPLVEGGANTDLFPGTEYTYDQTLDLSAGTHTFFFNVTPKATPGVALTTNLAISGGFSNASFSLTGPGGPFSPSLSIAGNNNFLAEFASIAFVVDSPYVLTLMFDLARAVSAAQVNVLVEVEPVPVPAALPLLATGLGVLGILSLRRKRKQAEAQPT